MLYFVKWYDGDDWHLSVMAEHPKQFFKRLKFTHKYDEKKRTLSVMYTEVTPEECSKAFTVVSSSKIFEVHTITVKIKGGESFSTINKRIRGLL